MAAEDGTILDYKSLFAMSYGEFWLCVDRCHDRAGEFRKKHENEWNPKGNTNLTTEESNKILELCDKFAGCRSKKGKLDFDLTERMARCLFNKSGSTIRSAYNRASKNRGEKNKKPHQEQATAHPLDANPNANPDAAAGGSFIQQGSGSNKSSPPKKHPADGQVECAFLEQLAEKEEESVEKEEESVEKEEESVEKEEELADAKQDPCALLEQLAEKEKELVEKEKELAEKKEELAEKEKELVEKEYELATKNGLIYRLKTLLPAGYEVASALGLYLDNERNMKTLQELLKELHPPPTHNLIMPSAEQRSLLEEFYKAQYNYESDEDDY